MLITDCYEQHSQVYRAGCSLGINPGGSIVGTQLPKRNSFPHPLRQGTMTGLSYSWHLEDQGSKNVDADSLKGSSGISPSFLYCGLPPAWSLGPWWVLCARAPSAPWLRAGPTRSCPGNGASCGETHQRDLVCSLHASMGPEKLPGNTGRSTWRDGCSQDEVTPCGALSRGCGEKVRSISWTWGLHFSASLQMLRTKRHAASCSQVP